MIRGVFLAVKINAAILTIFIAVVGIVSYFTTNENLPVINNSESVKLPIIMYHSVLKDTDLSGKFVVTPTEVENDIKYFQKAGYTSVSIREVIDYTENGGTLPEKPIMLTFDDGCYNNYGYVLQLLKQYGEKAVFCVVGEYADKYTEENIANMTYGYMRWSEINEMMSSGFAEIANHSYGFHSNTGSRNGSKRKQGETADAYIEIFRADTEKAQNRFIENCGKAPYIYAYPFGAYSQESFDVLKDMGFKATLSCNEGVNVITRGEDCLYLLKRYNRPSGISSAELFAKFED